MTTSRSTFTRISLVAILLATAFCLVSLAVAQEAQHQPSQPPPAATPAANQQAPAKETPAAESPEQHMAGASKEAAGEGHEEHEENIEFKQSASVKWLARLIGVSPRTASWALFGINFAIIAGLIVMFMRSKLTGWIRSQTEAIQQSMEEARRNSAEARARLSEIETRLSRIDAEISEMRAQAESEAKVEEQRIAAAAEDDKQHIIAAAEQEIAAASRQARHDLKQYAAELAVDLAERRIQVDPQTDRALVHNFASQFGKDGQ